MAEVVINQFEPLQRLVARCAVIAVALCLLLACSDDSLGSEPPARFVIANPPEGFELCDAVEGDPLGLPAGGSIEVWGDSSLADPWTGLLASAVVWTETEMPVHDAVRPVTVRGHAGYVGEAQMFQGVTAAA